MKKYLLACVMLGLSVPAWAATLPSRSLSGVTMQVAVPDVTNPNQVTFTVSADQSAVDHYELDILRPDQTALQTLNLGKPTPDANGSCSAPLNVQPVAFGNGYSAQLRAVAIGPDGPVSSPNVQSDNKFNRVPGAPSKLKIGG